MRLFIGKYHWNILNYAATLEKKEGVSTLFAKGRHAKRVVVDWDKKRLQL